MLPLSAYQLVFACSPVGEYLLSPTLEILDVNDAFLKATGRTRQELIGHKLFDVFPADPREDGTQGIAAVRASLRRVVDTRRPDALPLQRYPIEVTRPDGSRAFEERYWSALSTPVLDAQGQLVCISHSTMDVTGLQASGAGGRMEEALVAAMFDRTRAMHAATQAMRAERGRLWHLFNNAPGIVYFTREPQHLIELANDAFLTLVGRERSAVVGRTLREAFPEIDGQGIFELHDDVFRTARPFVAHAYRIVATRPGRPPDEIFLDLVYQPVLDEGGRVTGVCGQGTDVTGKVTAAAELRKSAHELREANRRKDEFLAMLAHELRNPLAPISAAAQLMQAGQLDEQRLRQTSQVISRQVAHMTGLVDDLLDVSRVTRGLVTLHNAPQDLRNIASNALEQVRPLIEKQHHHITVTMPPQPAFVYGDAKRLVQIVTNLLNNAAKYTPPGGHIRLVGEATEDEAIVHVVDDGIGIAPHMQRQVFELFAQAERTPDRSQGGLGLGLALVKSLAELHGGSVQCRSDGLGRGSCFTVRLPRLAYEAPQERRHASRDLERSAHPLKVLVVDDNADAAEMLAMLLEATGHEVVVAHKGHAALAASRAVVPDVCLLDIGLPDIDGNELARRLRAQPETAKSVLIAVTGYGQEQDRRAAMDAGFDHHLVKPVDPARLAALLDELEAA